MKIKWDEFYRKVLNWRNKHRSEQLTKFNTVCERSIKILQKRYGYTREKAMDELNTHYAGTWLG